MRVGECHVLVARLRSGEVVAFGPSCPHQFTELDDATIWDGNLRCPRHSYLFDTRTGENIHPRREAKVENLWKLRPGYLPCYEVREEDGWIWVSDETKPPPVSYDPSLEVRPSEGAGPDLTDMAAPDAVAPVAPGRPGRGVTAVPERRGGRPVRRPPPVPTPPRASAGVTRYWARSSSGRRTLRTRLFTLPGRPCGRRRRWRRHAHLHLRGRRRLARRRPHVHRAGQAGVNRVRSPEAAPTGGYPCTTRT